MIKAKKGNLIVLGLSDENISRLKKNEPIKFNLKDLDMGDVDVLIFNGRTEESMYEDMLPMISIYHTKLK